MKMLHHPFCSKSIAVLELLEKNNIPVEIIDLTDENFPTDYIKEAIRKSNLKTEDFIRKNEPVFAKKYADKLLNDIELIELMMKHRQLIQRPVLINDRYAIIGRPIEVVLDFIKNE